MQHSPKLRRVGRTLCALSMNWPYSPTGPRCTTMRRVSAPTMWKSLWKCTLAWCLLAALLGAKQAPNRPDYGLDALRETLALSGIDGSYEWTDCGEPNAAYIPITDQVFLCNELPLLASPGAIRAVYLHEVGHRVIATYNLAIPGLEEAAADEFSAWVLGALGRQDDLEATAVMWDNWPVQDEHVKDPHPSAARRAYTLRCLKEGSRPGSGHTNPGCAREWRRVVWRWLKLTGLAR